eukprot:2881979-Pleurochrysis_carterae.AAC.1
MPRRELGHLAQARGGTSRWRGSRRAPERSLRTRARAAAPQVSRRGGPPLASPQEPAHRRRQRPEGRGGGDG